VAGALRDLLPLAVGVAISPLPIMAVILILFTPRAKSNGPAFLLGWVIGLAAVSAIVFLLLNPQNHHKGSPTTLDSWIHLALGVLLLFLALRRWRGRPGPGELPTPPKWMTKLAEFGPRQSMTTGALLSGVNPKNTILTIAAASSVAQANVGPAETTSLILIYIVIASVTIATPVALLTFAPERAEKILTRWRTELALHGTAVGVTLFVVFGALLVGKGLAGLL
jgi:threonine/homoserine/homoserine lactone efflux protein